MKYRIESHCLRCFRLNSNRFYDRISWPIKILTIALIIVNNNQNVCANMNVFGDFFFAI